MVSTFTYGTTKEALIHELGRGRPRTTTDLLYIATKFADGDDAVGAIFGKGKSPRDTDKPCSEKRERWEHPDRHRRNHHPRRGEEEVATMDRPSRQSSPSSLTIVTTEIGSRTQGPPHRWANCGLKAPIQGAHRRGSNLNIMHIETFDGLGIACSALRPSSAPFHGVVPGHQAYSLRRITQPITFGDPPTSALSSCSLRWWTSRGSYNAILGRPCHAKFMVVSNYTYLKLKMPEPVESSHLLLHSKPRKPASRPTASSPQRWHIERTSWVLEVCSSRCHLGIQKCLWELRAWWRQGGVLTSTTDLPKSAWISVMLLYN
jgi:hypothetical protein